MGQGGEKELDTRSKALDREDVWGTGAETMGPTEGVDSPNPELWDLEVTPTLPVPLPFSSVTATS